MADMQKLNLKSFQGNKRKLKYIFLTTPEANMKTGTIFILLAFIESKRPGLGSLLSKNDRDLILPRGAQRYSGSLCWNVLRRWFLSQGDETLQQWVWSFLHNSCLPKGWLWWPQESGTEGLLGMPGDQPQKTSHKSMNLMLVITTRLLHPFPTRFYTWNCSPGRWRSKMMGWLLSKEPVWKLN